MSASPHILSAVKYSSSSTKYVSYLGSSPIFAYKQPSPFCFGMIICPTIPRSNSSL